MFSNEMRVLFGKEWKQAVRNRGAVLTAVLLPVLFLLVVPAAQAFAASQGIATSNLTTGSLPPGLTDASPKAIFTQMMFPMFLVIGGLIVPSVAASYTVVSEREKRTIDLLTALPVSLGQIIGAKLAAISALGILITLPLALIDCALLLALGLADPLLIGGYIFELFAALLFSVASAMATALFAKDFRSSNNISGLFMGPMILLTLGFGLLLPWGLYRLFLHGALLLVLGVAILFVALKTVSVERFAL